MFGIEKIISKPLLKWIWNSKDDQIGTRTKIVLGSYSIIHLISVILMSWMLYRLFIQKKKDKWSLIIQISSLAVFLIIPYKLGDFIADSFVGLFSNVGKFTQFLTWTGLVISAIGIVLYFFDVQFTKKGDGEEENKDEEVEK